ncbi:hypothetical protein JA1_000914 [Spathaspora sp. JA1]|nr:hypothetical protein JA1_000914 [Spathaspora sp. JA1]
MARDKSQGIDLPVIGNQTESPRQPIKHKLEHLPTYHPKKHKYYYGGHDENKLQQTNNIVDLSIGKVSKHRLTQGEELLLKKFDDEILNSIKTKPILDNLSGNTFKSYFGDIKRFIKFCAGQQGKTDFLLDENILSKFLTSESKKRPWSLTRFRNIRSSLLKLHQLNSLVYDDVKYSEGEIGYFINNIKPANSDDTSSLQDKLLLKLQNMFKTTSLLSGLSETSKKLYCNEYNRYVIFCAQEGLDHFHLTGELLKKYFQGIINRSPNISQKKLHEILSRLNRLHAVNVEMFSNYPAEINDIHIVKQFLKEYNETNGITQISENTSFRETAQLISPYKDNVPEFIMNRDISTVTQLVEEWEMVLQRNKKWGLGWIKSEIDEELYQERKVIVDFINELMLEIHDDRRYYIANVIDTYMTRKKIGLHDLTEKIKKYRIYSKREFLRILEYDIEG